MKNLTILEQDSGSYFTFYDNKLGTILRDPEGFEYATVRESIEELAGKYGGAYINSKQGTRRCSLKGDLIGDNVFTLRKNLLNALRQTGTIKLIKFTTYDDIDLQFEAEVVKYINSYTHKVHTFLIELLAPDWRFYSQVEKSYDLSQTIIKGGATIPATIPMDIALSTNTDVIVDNIIENNGNEATDPIFTINGPGTNFQILNLTTGTELDLDYSLVDTDEVVIDVKNRTVVLNGITNIYSAIDGDFWSLNPGENEIRFFIESGITVDTNLNISFREAYNGI